MNPVAALTKESFFDTALVDVTHFAFTHYFVT
jgi:hypothetical protein